MISRFKSRFLFALVLLCSIGSTAQGQYVVTGLDTVDTYRRLAFDFVAAVACTTSAGYSACFNDFDFAAQGGVSGGVTTWGYDIVADNGYGAKEGKVNLDSLLTAPPDSIFAKSYLTVGDIPVDSLPSHVGCSYWIKTAPYPVMDQIMFAKLRILSFKVVDSTNHKVDMRFLWACDLTGDRNVPTSGLDTFHLPTSGVLSGPHSQITAVAGKRSFAAVAGRFIVPQELAGRSGMLAVYSLTGRRLGRVTFAAHTREIDLKKAGILENGVVVVKIERTIQGF